MIRHVSLSFSLNPADSNHVQPQVSPLGWWLPSGGLSSSSNQRLGLAVGLDIQPSVGRVRRRRKTTNLRA